MIIEGREFFNFFLLGIGGSGMSSLAHILLDFGFSVEGYDKKNSKVIEDLEERAVRIYSEIPDPEKFPNHCFVFSSALQDKFPKLQSDFQKTDTFHRSKVMHSLFREKKTISVAGSHGKTSTTAMVSQCLLELGLDPSFMIGGETFFYANRGGRGGKGEWAVYESDESDGTFVNHIADIRILTNIDNDHLDFYKNRDTLEHAFLKYLALQSPGFVILQGQDPGIQVLLERNSNEFQKSRSQIHILAPNQEIFLEKVNSLIPSAKLTIFGIQGQELSYWKKDEARKKTLSLSFAGEHYLTNALSANLALQQTGVTESEIILELKKYRGVKRRQELLGVHPILGFRVIDDYGHHPTEILQVWNSLKRDCKGTERIVVLFQPHRYTRTQHLLPEFVTVLKNVDALFLLPIYSAGEREIPGVDSHQLVLELQKAGANSRPILLEGDLKQDLDSLLRYLKPEDTLLTIGAGNVREWGEAILEKNI